MDAASQQITRSLHQVLSAMLEEDSEALIETELETRWVAREYDPAVLSRVTAILKEADLIRFAPALTDKQATRQLVERANAAVSDMTNSRLKAAA
jgi:hypothetical protein